MALCLPENERERRIEAGIIEGLCRTGGSLIIGKGNAYVQSICSKNGERLNQIQKFKYLDSHAAPDGTLHSQITDRIQTVRKKVSGVLCDNRKNTESLENDTKTYNDT